MPSASFCMVFGEGRAQVGTASLADSDMHGEADKTEKQKARGSWVGAGVDMLQQSVSKVRAVVRRRVICVACSGGGRSGA